MGSMMLLDGGLFEAGEGLGSEPGGCITIIGLAVSSRVVTCEGDLEARGVSERARSSSPDRRVGGISDIVACTGLEDIQYEDESDGTRVQL